jgi:hypothetical protein
MREEKERANHPTSEPAIRSGGWIPKRMTFERSFSSFNVLDKTTTDDKTETFLIGGKKFLNQSSSLLFHLSCGLFLVLFGPQQRRRRRIFVLCLVLFI